jgi:hypothetical protein
MEMTRDVACCIPRLFSSEPIAYIYSVSFTLMLYTIKTLKLNYFDLREFEFIFVAIFN